MKNLAAKRWSAGWAIVQQATLSGIACVAPTPLVETGKHIAIAGNEIFLCIRIYNIYYEEHITEEVMITMLTEAGLITAMSGGLVYMATKGSQTLISELSNFILPIGAAITVPLAASVTGLLGIAFLLFIDKKYQHDHPRPEFA